MNKETAIVTAFIQKGTPIHRYYEINSLQDFIDICEGLIFDNTNDTQKELIASSLNKVDWESIAKLDRDRAEEENKKREEMPKDNIPF